MKHLNILAAWLVFVGMQSCDNNKPVDRQAVIEEMESRELKRVTGSEIMTTAMTMGDTIVSLAEKELKSALMGAIKEGGVPYALEFCNANALEVTKKVEEDYDVTIERVSEKYRNPIDEPDSLESLILEAYAYNVENGLEVEPAIIEESNEVLLYSKPIKIAGGLCLNCHGKVGQEISEENYDQILSFYPDDKAIDYALNDLRGMWVIRIPKKTVVNAL